MRPPGPLDHLRQRGISTGFANPGGVSTPAMEELHDLSISATDVDERRAVLQAGSREMAESVLEVVVLFPEVASDD